MKAVILLSGGIDSTVLLADRVHAGDDCRTITFNYGQRNAHQETDAADWIARHYGIQPQIINLPIYISESSALIGPGNIPDTHAEEPDTTTVPARNLVMLAIGAAIADQIGANAVMFGANDDDAAGYLDCRHRFVTALDDAVNLGTSNGVTICAPYLSWTKTHIVKRGIELNAPLHMTYSCYRGKPIPCGHCGACQSRQEAFT